MNVPPWLIHCLLTSHRDEPQEVSFSLSAMHREAEAPSYPDFHKKFDLYLLLLLFLRQISFNSIEQTTRKTDNDAAQAVKAWSKPTKARLSWEISLGLCWRRTTIRFGYRSQFQRSEQRNDWINWPTLCWQRQQRNLLKLHGSLSSRSRFYNKYFTYTTFKRIKLVQFYE